MVNSRRFSNRPFLPWLALVIAVGCWLTSRPAASRTLDPKTVREVVLPNGLRLVIKEARGADLAAIQLWVRAGGFLEDEKTSGYAHAIEHLVFKGTLTQPTGKIDDEIENLGGLLSATTEKDWTMFGTTVAATYTDKVLTVLADAIRRPRLQPEDYRLEKLVLLDEINSTRVDPLRVLTLGLYELSYKTHPYQRDVRGTPRILNTLDLNAVREYFNKYYVAQNMAIVVVGNVDGAQVEQKVRALFGAMPGGKELPFTVPAEEMACREPQREVIDTRFNAAYLGMAFPGPSVSEQPDVHAMDLLLTLLEEGDFGRLPTALRGKVTALGTSFETRRQKGLYTIRLTTSPELLAEVEKLVQAEIRKVAQNGVSEQELAFTKRVLHGSFAQDNETFTGQASTLGYYAAINSYRFGVDYLDKINAVTPEQVQAVATKYLNVDHSCTLILRPQPAEAK